MPRHFPPPWSIEEGDACFIVRDGGKQALGYVYFENEPGRRSSAKLAEHRVRDEVVAGSNPAAPTNFLTIQMTFGERYGARNSISLLSDAVTNHNKAGR